MYAGELESPTHWNTSFVSGGGINYFRDKDKLCDLYARLERNPYINQGTLDFWYIKFQNWLHEKCECMRITVYYESN